MESVGINFLIRSLVNICVKLKMLLYSCVNVVFVAFPHMALLLLGCQTTTTDADNTLVYAYAFYYISRKNTSALF